MATYVVFRIGSNAYNQERTQKMAIAVLDATNRTKALEKAHRLDERITDLYNNQCLSVEPKSKVSKSDWQEAINAHRWNTELVPIKAISCQLCGKHPDKPLPRFEANFWHCGCMP